MTPWPRVWCGGPERPTGVPTFTVAFPCATVNESNGTTQRWAKVNRRSAARASTQEAMTPTAVAECLTALYDSGGPWCVRLTRISPSKLDDDATPLALKTVRDTVAAALGVDDGSPTVAFCYAQENGKPIGVRIEIWGPGGLP